MLQQQNPSPLITLHGAGGAGKTTLITRLQELTSSQHRHQTFPELADGLFKASQTMQPNRSKMDRIFSPPMLLKHALIGFGGGAQSVLMAIEVILMGLLIWLFANGEKNWGKIGGVLAVMGSLLGMAYGGRIMNSVFLSAVWLYNKQQHLKVLKYIEDRENPEHDIKYTDKPEEEAIIGENKENNEENNNNKDVWLWLDRNVVDVIGYGNGYGKVECITDDFIPVLKEQTKLLSCGVWVDPPVELIRKHHLMRAKNAKNSFGKYTSYLLYYFPSIFIPTIKSVYTVKDWYQNNNIPFLLVSEWREKHKNELVGLDDSGEMNWNDHNLNLFIKTIEGLIEERERNRMESIDLSLLSDKVWKFRK